MALKPFPAAATRSEIDMSKKHILLPYARYLEANWRKQKKHDNQCMGPLAQAYSQGQYAGEVGRRLVNPYPPGRRHDEFERGFAVEVGARERAHYGRNV